MKRRKFIQNTALGSLGVVTATSALSCNDKKQIDKKVAAQKNNPKVTAKVIATWNVNQAVDTAYNTLIEGFSALDAIEKGCNIEEANAVGQSVGIGGLPDRDGNVTLDACIMDHQGNYGAVVYLQNIKHAISVARKVMENTPHVILAGEGAKQFALLEGFKEENLLTEASKKAWEEWKITSIYKPIINIENHDTIGMLAIDKQGNLSGGCTTSGLAYKMAGRVGDSPIIGSGLFVDNAVGAATATGLGEEVLKTVGSFLIVELMRQGKTPQEACEEDIGRIVKNNPRVKDFKVGYIAINKRGETGYYSIHKGFWVTQNENGTSTNTESKYYLV